MRIQDILKKSFLAQFDSSLSTTSIIAALLRAAGKTVYLGGNIGNPLFQMLDDINNMKAGDIRIGGTNYVCSYILPLIVSEFSALYPNVDISIYEANSVELEKMLQNERIDLIIDSYDTKDEQLEYT